MASELVLVSDYRPYAATAFDGFCASTAVGLGDTLSVTLVTDTAVIDGLTVVSVTTEANCLTVLTDMTVVVVGVLAAVTDTTVVDGLTVYLPQGSF